MCARCGRRCPRGAGGSRRPSQVPGRTGGRGSPPAPRPAAPAGPCRAPAPARRGSPGGVMGVGLRAPPGPALPRACLGKGRGLWTGLPGPEELAGVRGSTWRLPAGGGVPGRWGWSCRCSLGPAPGPCPAQFHVPGSRLLVPPPFPSRPLQSFVRPPCLSPAAVVTELPRARAPLLKAKEVLGAFSGLLLSSHHTLLCLPGSLVSIPAGVKYLSSLLCPFLVSPLSYLLSPVRYQDTKVGGSALPVCRL